LPHYFPISQGEGGDIQQRIASADTLGAICCSHNPALPWANQRKSRSNWRSSAQ